MAEVKRSDLINMRKKAEVRLEEMHRGAKKKIMNQKTVPVYIPTVYKSRLGANLPISVGLETITIPVDGKTYNVREPFAVALKRHLAQIDKEAARNNQTWGTFGSGDVSATGPIPGK